MTTSVYHISLFHINVIVRGLSTPALAELLIFALLLLDREGKVTDRDRELLRDLTS